MRLEDWPVALLAGGLATRLRPLTKRIPKALVKVADEPFLAHQLRLLHAQGIRQVVLCVGYLGEMIEAQFGNGAAYGMNLRYSFDGPRLLGTGGALKRALPALGDLFFVIYGDSYLPTNYAKVAQAFLGCGKPAMMTVFKNRHRWDTSNIEFDGKEIIRYDKTNPDKTMEYIDYGLSIFRSETFANCPSDSDKPFELAQFYPNLIIRNQLAGFEVKERFYEIGSPDGLAELDCLLRESPASTQS
jgi:NDP-sugar pyrophosphorylase family protein